MADITRKWDYLPKEKRDAAIREIATYFASEHDKEFGMIASEDILDFFLSTAGKDIYNKGIEDARKFLKDRFFDLDIGLDLLTK